MLVLSAGDVLAAPMRVVGAKAATLARLAAAGLPVPRFFVLGAEALRRHLAEHAIGWPVGWPVADADARAARGAIVAAPVPPTVAEAVMGAFQGLGAERVAVRSSGAEEDSAEASFAGQFASVLAVAGPDLLGAVQECWASSLSESSLRYRAAQGIPLNAEPAFGVIIQSQVFPTSGGVLFTEHPLWPGSDQAYLEANVGTGESVVGGFVTPDAVTLSRTDGKLHTRVAVKHRMTTISLASRGSTVVDVDEAARHAPVLTDDVARSLFALGTQVEALLGAPQDIEWAIDAAGPWLLQSRPLTGPARGRG
ncbi:MAG: hypothetical protein NVSMB32_05230 [Actinomycetota bacterium]